MFCCLLFVLSGLCLYVVVGCLLSVDCCSLFVIRCLPCVFCCLFVRSWLVVDSCLPFLFVGVVVVCLFLLIVVCWLFRVGCCLLFGARGLSFVVCLSFGLLVVVCCVLFIACCLLRFLLR